MTSSYLITDENIELGSNKVSSKKRNEVVYEIMHMERCVANIASREAAIEAAKTIGLRQIKEMDMSKFGKMKKEAEMFQMRLHELKKYVSNF